MEALTAKYFRFADFELDGAKRLLLKQGKPVALNSKTFDLLLALVERHGEILSKDELLEKVWEGQFVEEGNLTVQVSTLRKIFGERKDEHRFIVTVPGKGYSFVAELTDGSDDEIIVESHSLSRIVVEETEEEINGGDGSTHRLKNTAANANQIIELLAGETSLQATEHPTNSTGKLFPLNLSKRNLIRIIFALMLLATAIFAFTYFFKSQRKIDSVAVLPFVNVGDDPKMEYLSDGITESLINFLSQSSNLKVIARSSVFRYKVSDSQASTLDPQKIASELGVQAVLTGRVVQRGEDLFISVELIDTSDNTHLWGEKYTRKFTDVFAVQEEIATDISKKLRLKLTGEERREIARRYTDNLKAFENYMMGRSYVHRRTREDLLTAAGYFERAIKEDQNYGLAYTGLAEVYGSMGVRGYMSIVESRQKLADATRKALLLDDNLAEAHALLGASLTTYTPFHFPEGDRELKRAIELSPSLAIAHLFLSLSLLRQGRLDEGLTEMQKARELDPFSGIIARQMSLYYNLKREHVRALEVLRQANETGIPFTTSAEINIYIQNRQYDEALTGLEKAKQQRKDDPILIFSTGMIYAAQGKHTEAMAIIRELEKLSGTDLRQSPFIAKIYVLLGDKEQAFKWLEKGLSAGEIANFYKDEPVWDALRNDSRFAGLLLRMRVPQ